MYRLFLKEICWGRVVSPFALYAECNSIYYVCCVVCFLQYRARNNDYQSDMEAYLYLLDIVT